MKFLVIVEYQTWKKIEITIADMNESRLSFDLTQIIYYGPLYYKMLRKKNIP